ncbi:MAG: hypothetical protein DME60_14165 [Verrucomicrobia bacterium]|nr:MAG: hypothetical protein DME60_14165 [Verrucomicrobiota bacterium]
MINFLALSINFRLNSARRGELTEQRCPSHGCSPVRKWQSTTETCLGSTRGSRVGFGGSPKQSSDQNSIQTGAIDFVKGRAEPVATPNASRPQ